jgi:polyisoprenoid-binding protein YceI
MLQDGIWDVDAHDSTLAFAVKEVWGLRTVRGAFTRFHGSLRVHAGEAAGDLTIEPGSLDTGHKRRDEHLRSPAFFDVEHQPQIAFRATRVAPSDGGLTIFGSLTIGSSRTPLEVPVSVEQVEHGRCRLEGEVTVSRSAAGLTWNKLGMIRDEAVLHARVTLRRGGAG